MQAQQSIVNVFKRLAIARTTKYERVCKEVKLHSTKLFYFYA